MVSAHDVAAYILKKKGVLTAMKLQKLVYYCQAWSLVWDEEPLFEERIEAWANGPVIRDLYRHHKGQFKVSDWPNGDPSRLGPKERQTVDAVLRYYGDKSSQWLSDLTHQEQPWVEARSGLKPGDPGAREIKHAAMAEYYGSLT